MDLLRIGELVSLINRLNEILTGLNARKTNLEKEVPGTKSAQDQLEVAAASAQNRVSALASLGLRSEFLEDIIRPVRDMPDCSGIGTTVENEISGIEDEIRHTNSQIWSADQEKRQLEMEAP